MARGDGKKRLPGGFLYDLIAKLAPRESDVAEWVGQLRTANPKLGTEELAEYISDYIVWMYATQGAALALPGAIPGLGTVLQVATEVGATSADISLMVRNQTYLVFALGPCYGVTGRRTLIQDALICIGLWTNALVLSKPGTIHIGAKVAQANFKKRFPAAILKRINQKVGTTVVTKYGVKRGGIAIGRLIPFGVGIAVGGGFNYVVMKRFGSKAREYMSLTVQRP
jgi:hypothetical protein